MRAWEGDDCKHVWMHAMVCVVWSYCCGSLEGLLELVAKQYERFRSNVYTEISGVEAYRLCQRTYEKASCLPKHHAAITGIGYLYSYTAYRSIRS